MNNKLQGVDILRHLARNCSPMASLDIIFVHLDAGAVGKSRLFSLFQSSRIPFQTNAPCSRPRTIVVAD